MQSDWSQPRCDWTVSASAFCEDTIEYTGISSTCHSTIVSIPEPVTTDYDSSDRGDRHVGHLGSASHSGSRRTLVSAAAHILGPQPIRPESSTCARRSEKTDIGQRLSGPLVSTLIGLAASNLGLIPCEAPAYTVVNRFLLPLAVPLLLFAADLRRVVRDTGRLLLAFLLGTGLPPLCTPSPMFESLHPSSHPPPLGCSRYSGWDTCRLLLPPPPIPWQRQLEDRCCSDEPPHRGGGELRGGHGGAAGLALGGGLGAGGRQPHLRPLLHRALCLGGWDSRRGWGRGRSTSQP